MTKRIEPPAVRTPPRLFTISEVSESSGLAIATLRFYERELPGFIQVAKTEGGHRRYTEANLKQFRALRILIEDEELTLAQIKQMMREPQSQEGARREIDLLLEVYEQLVKENDAVKRRLAALEKLAAALEQGLSEVSRQRSEKKKRSWF